MKTMMMVISLLNLSSIRMKELRAAEINLKTGMTLYDSNPTKAEPEFTGNTGTTTRIAA